jgi:hypothetical protein
MCVPKQTPVHAVYTYGLENLSTPHIVLYYSTKKNISLLCCTLHSLKVRYLDHKSPTQPYPDPVQPRLHPHPCFCKVSLKLINSMLAYFNKTLIFALTLSDELEFRILKKEVLKRILGVKK